MNKNIEDHTIAVIGLGYVGMPLAITLSNHVKTIGFDINDSRISELKRGEDSNGEIEESVLRTTSCLFTNFSSDIKDCSIYIVTVPTPVDPNNCPDLGPVESASKMVASLLKKGDIVVYESTVYPGVTEDICGSLLENYSGLKCGSDFFLGYSPERINPGDIKHTVQNITKVVSGQTPEVTSLLSKLYGCVNNDNIFIAKDIRTAEASKAIENAQRDINVAFVNEITMILNKMGLSSYDVLEAAGTKWNFLPFVPGLVGGHCISVDPYYLAQCAEKIGHTPEVILSGRKINDSMGAYIGDRVDQTMHDTGKAASANVLILGFTFKENINDIRNTKVVDVVKRLKSKGHNIDIHDPHAKQEEVKEEYGLELISSLNDTKTYDSIVLLVAHQSYREMTAETIESKLSNDGVIFDMRGLWRDLNFSQNITFKSL